MAPRKKKVQAKPIIKEADPFDAPVEDLDDAIVPEPEPEEQPIAEEAIAAGFIPDEETEPCVESKPSDPEPPPSVEELIRAGQSLDEAQANRRRLEEEYFIAQRKGRPFYRIRGVTPRGYWKIGRHFGLKETILFDDELSDEEKAELDRTNPLHLDVERIGFDHAG